MRSITLQRGGSTGGSLVCYLSRCSLRKSQMKSVEAAAADGSVSLLQVRQSSATFERNGSLH